MVKRSVFLTLVAAVSVSAQAQWGIGLSPASQCPYQQNPAGGAINGGDEVANLQGRLNNGQQQLERKKAQLAHLDDEIKADRADMQTVLSSRVVDSIMEHRRYSRNAADYQDCNWDGRTASAGTSVTDAFIPGGNSNPGGTVDQNRIPPPQDFCYAPSKRNAWDKLVLDNGQVSDQVCDYNVGTWRGHPDAGRSSRCKQGLKDYYSLMDQKTHLETEIAQIDADDRNYERKLNRIQDEIAEGTYCPYCEAQRQGYSSTSSSTGSVVSSLLPLAGMLAIAGVSYYNGEQQRKLERQRMILNARTGWGAYGGPFGGYPPMPGPGAFPGNPYPAPMPGYMGVNNGFYGAMPGSIGPGGFGCQGTSPYAQGNPFAAPVNPFLNGGQPNVFGNPYLNQMNNPAMQNSMLMPGFGPGFMPVLGNGINGYNPYGNTNPYMLAQNPFMNQFNQNPYAQNPFAQMNNPYAPAMLPYNGQNAFFNSPYQFANQNPYGPGGYNPYGPGGGAYNPYAQYNPYGPGGGGYNPYNPYGPGGGGYNPYAPGMLPYPGPGGGAFNSPYGNPYAAGYGNPYGGAFGTPYNGVPGGGLVNYNPYGNPYGGSPYGGNSYALGNFYMQMEQLKSQISSIQSSPIFGGSAPSVLPYPGPGSYSSPVYNSPIYNTPGTVNNPGYYYNTGTTTTGGSVNVIRSR